MGEVGRMGQQSSLGSEVIQGGEVSAASEVGGRKQTKQVSGTGKMKRDAAQALRLRSELDTRRQLAQDLVQR